MVQVLRRPGVEGAHLIVRLGPDDMDQLDDSIGAATPDGPLTIEVVGFDYFDLGMLERLLALPEDDPRVARIEGLEQLGSAFGVAATPANREPVQPDAVVHLAAVTIVVAWKLATEGSWDAALDEAESGGAELVTIDLRCLEELSVRRTIAITELSADLERAGRQLLLVNASPGVAHQLRHAGLHGSVHTSVDELS